MRWPQFLIASLCSVAFSTPVFAADFNQYILKSIGFLYNHYAKGGYNIDRAFTHDIPYGSDGPIKATHPPETMCVAAVAEIIMEAINIYVDETGDSSLYNKIPTSAWSKGNVLSLRANIFMFDGTGSRGTGFTLAEFGLGEELRFQDLTSGDFINLNRNNRTGHSVVFIKFIKRDLTLTDTYDDDVVGFQYFSAQGKGLPDGGLSYRDAFFEGFCPNTGSVRHDCGIIKSSNRALFDTGRMWSPSQWGYLQAVARKRVQTRSAILDDHPTESRGVIDQLLNLQLEKDLNMSQDEKSVLNGSTIE